jgi:hypothetical protein
LKGYKTRPEIRFTPASTNLQESPGLREKS